MYSIFKNAGKGKISLSWKIMIVRPENARYNMVVDVYFIQNKKMMIECCKRVEAEKIRNKLRDYMDNGV